MKQSIIKSLAIGLSLLATVSLSAQNNYQLPNNGFESWDGSANDAEPTHWNSFATCDGSWSSLASSTHHYHRHGSRPGGTGSHYLTIYTQSILGIKANGNMTTGRIHAGSLSASSSDNYNYTERSNADHSCPFTATPDSMYVWVSFYAGSGNSVAQVEAVLHGNSDFKAPNDVSNTSLYKGRAVAEFTRTTTSDSQMQWQLMKVPFVYNGTSTANYMLVNMTTNKNPGEGDGYDSLSVDDIEFIYSAWLTSIKVNGEAVEGFQKDNFYYSVSVEDMDALQSAVVEGVTEVSDATVSVSRETISDTSVRVTLTVKAEDSVTVREYHVVLSTGMPVVSIADVQQEEALRVYPNPVENVLNVKGDGRVMVWLLFPRQYALVGQNIWRQSLPSSKRLSPVWSVPTSCEGIRPRCGAGVWRLPISVSEHG